MAACLFEDSAHFVRSGPSHRHLRHRFATTCCRRAPPPSRVRGWTRPSEPTANRIAPYHQHRRIIANHPVQHMALESFLRGFRAPSGRFKWALGASPCARAHSTRGSRTGWLQINACHRIKAVTCSTSRCTNLAICLTEQTYSRLIFFASNPRSWAVRYRTPNLPNIA